MDAPLTRLQPLPTTIVPDLLRFFTLVEESITRATQQADVEPFRGYLLAVAADLIQPAIVFHPNVDIRRSAAKCLNAILLPPVPPKLASCRHCNRQFRTFSEAFSHEPACESNNTIPANLSGAASSTSSTNLPSMPPAVLKTATVANPVAAAAAAKPAATGPSPRDALRSSGRVALRSSGSRGGCLSIHYAARAGNIEAIRWFLQNGTKVNDRDEHGNTALYYAVLCSHISAVISLFDLGAYLDMHDPEAERYMMASSLQAIRDVLRARAVNGKVKREEGCALFKPALEGRKEHMTHLLRKSTIAHINATHKSGYTPLDLAVFRGHKEVAQMLRNAGAWNTLTSDMQTLLANGAFADAEFLVENRSLPVHMCVLEARIDLPALLKYLDATQATSSSSNAAARFHVHRNLRYVDLYAILSWIYAGNILTADEKAGLCLLEMARAVNLPTLAGQVGDEDCSKIPLGKLPEVNLASSYEALHRTRTTMDIEFTSESGVSFFAHKAIMSARSAYFNTMFNSGMKEARANTIQLDPNVSDEAFTVLLLYMYTDSVGDVANVNGDLALELISLSSRWMLPSLRHLAEQLVLSEFSIDWIDAIELWQYARLHGAQQFAKACHTVLANNEVPMDKHPSWAALTPQEKAALEDDSKVKKRSVKK